MAKSHVQMSRENRTPAHLILLVNVVGLLDIDVGGEEKDELSHLPGAENALLNGFPRGYL